MNKSNRCLQIYYGKYIYINKIKVLSVAYIA